MDDWEGVGEDCNGDGAIVTPAGHAVPKLMPRDPMNRGNAMHADWPAKVVSTVTVSDCSPEVTHWKSR
jgi:hypothetical protein